MIDLYTNPHLLYFAECSMLDGRDKMPDSLGKAFFHGLKYQSESDH